MAIASTTTPLGDTFFFDGKNFTVIRQGTSEGVRVWRVPTLVEEKLRQQYNVTVIADAVKLADEAASRGITEEVEYLYGGTFYSWNGHQYFSSSIVREEVECTEHGQADLWNFGPQITVTGSGTYHVIDAEKVSDDIREILARQLTEKLTEAIKKDDSCKAYATECARRKQEAAGDGDYICPVCGHRQNVSGECHHCGDAFVVLSR